MNIKCPKCESSYEVTAEYQGRQVECNCGEKFIAGSDTQSEPTGKKMSWKEEYRPQSELLGEAVLWSGKRKNLTAIIVFSIISLCCFLGFILSLTDKNTDGVLPMFLLLAGIFFIFLLIIAMQKDYYEITKTALCIRKAKTTRIILLDAIRIIEVEKKREKYTICIFTSPSPGFIYVFGWITNLTADKIENVSNPQEVLALLTRRQSKHGK